MLSNSGFSQIRAPNLHNTKCSGAWYLPVIGEQPVTQHEPAALVTLQVVGPFVEPAPAGVGVGGLGQRRARRAHRLPSRLTHPATEGKSPHDAERSEVAAGFSMEEAGPGEEEEEEEAARPDLARPRPAQPRGKVRQAAARGFQVPASSLSLSSAA